MRKLLLLSLLMVSVCGYARQISEDEAAAIATEFLNSTTVRQTPAKTAVHRAKAPNATEAETAPFYVFNADNSQGFVIVSADDRAQRILGYSDKGTFDFNNLPPQLNAMLENYGEQIKNIPANTPTHASWKAPMHASEEGGVLLETAEWGQDYPYNLQTPVINGIQCPTGCVPTAMAIMMQYYNWPQQGNGKHTNAYNADLFFDFDNYFPDWSKMPAVVTDEINDEQKTEISKLMLAAGIGIDVMYNYAESGADCTFVENVLSSRFNFAPARTLYKKYMTDDDWERTIVNELDNERIILYRGDGGEKTDGHMFIIDGYSPDNLYHVNWGWDGDMNCYVNIGNITVGNADFSKGHMMVIGIEPNITDVRYSSFMVNDGVGRFDYLTNGGFNFSSDHIETGVPFQAVYPIVYGNPDNLGFVTLALINESDEIVEIISPYGEDLEGRHHDGALGNEGVYLYECGDYKLNKNGYIYCAPQLVVKSEIKPGYKLQLVGRDTPDSKWEFIAPSNLISTTVELDKPLRSEWVDINIEYDEDYMELRPVYVFNTTKKGLKDATCRLELIYGGGGKIVWDKSSTLQYRPIYDDGCTVSIAQTLDEDVNYFAKVEYIPEKMVFSQNVITDNQIIIDGIVYEIDADGLNSSEPNTSAKIIGFTEDCPNNVTLASDVEIAGKQYPVKYVTTGAFAGNKNIEHLNILSDYYFLSGALSHMSGLKSITVNDNKSLDGFRFILHKSNKLNHLYEIGVGQNSAYVHIPNEWLNQLVFAEWSKYGVSPDWYIEDPLIYIFDRVCVTESDNPPHFFVPGQSVNFNSEGLKKVEITEMWLYAINKSMGIVKITPQVPQVAIDRVLINGEEIKGENGLYYYNSNGLAPEVKVDYTVNNQQAMSTVYNSDFNATLPDEAFSGITEIKIDVDASVSVYNLQGILLKENVDSKTLSSLPTATYIVRQGEKAQKIVVNSHK